MKLYFNEKYTRFVAVLGCISIFTLQNQSAFDTFIARLTGSNGILGQTEYPEN